MLKLHDFCNRACLRNRLKRVHAQPRAPYRCSTSCTERHLRRSEPSPDVSQHHVARGTVVIHLMQYAD